MELCHFGTIYGRRNPAGLLTALCRLLDAGALNATKLRVRFVGLWEVDDPSCNSDAARLEAAGILTREESIPHRESLLAMSNADILLVLQPDTPLQVPGKIYEYVSTGRPLLVIGGEGATAALVRRHALGLCTPGDPDRLQAVVIQLLQGNGIVPPPPEVIREFDYETLTARLANVFESAVRETPSAFARATP
jgi:hypothetical protein